MQHLLVLTMHAVYYCVMYDIFICQKVNSLSVYDFTAMNPADSCRSHFSWRNEMEDTMNKMEHHIMEQMKQKIESIMENRGIYGETANKNQKMTIMEQQVNEALGIIKHHPSLIIIY